MTGAPQSDVLIVGAGPVGLVLGTALARAGLRVTILEGGPAQPPVAFAARNQGPNTGIPHQGLTEGRMKAFGGTGRLWGGQLVPFGRSDFAPTFAGKPAWPIGYDEIEPYFGRAFDFLGIDASARQLERVWESVGAVPVDLGPNITATMNLWLPVPDLARHFERDLAGLPNLEIVTGSEASGLAFAEDGMLAGIEANGRTWTATRYVLANGTMEIARLLLRAAAASAHCPFAANRHIGRGFVDHLHGIVGRVHPQDTGRLRTMFENIYRGGVKYSVKLRASDRFLEESRLGNCAVTLNAVGSIRQTLSDLRDLAKHVVARRGWRQAGRAIAETTRTLRLALPIVWNHTVRRRSYSLFDRGIFLGLELEQVPTRESYLFLDPEAPPETAAIGVHWALDGRELDFAAAFCAEVGERFAEAGLGTIEIDPRIEARDPAVLAEFHDAFHHMGGARMAANSDEGVVDPELRVFGCANLSVAGAAVYPSGSFANPTLTAMALAHRLADRLIAELRSADAG